MLETDALESKLGSMTVEAKEKADKDLAKKQVKEEARLEREAAKKKSSVVYIKRVERTKRKHVIIVSGIEAFGLDLKKVAKDFGKKFACGSSVTKNATGADEITVQGDVSEEIYDELTEKYGVEERNIKQIEEKKKSAGT